MKLAKLKKNSRMSVTVPVNNGAPLRLNLGSGPTKKEGFISVDAIAFPGVDVVMDLRDKWPWDDNSVEEAQASHVLEHFDAMERCHFLNELWRVLKPGAKCTMICPSAFSGRAYGDPTHKFPPVVEFGFLYWKRDWRLSQAPHTDAANLPGGFNCNFEVTGGYNLHPDVAARNQEYQQYAITFLKEAAQDLFFTVVKLP